MSIVVAEIIAESNWIQTVNLSNNNLDEQNKIKIEEIFNARNIQVQERKQLLINELSNSFDFPNDTVEVVGSYLDYSIVDFEL